MKSQADGATWLGQSMNPKILLLFILSWSAIGPSYTQAQQPAADSAFEFTFPAMGTLLAFQAFSQDEQLVEKTFQAARREVERLVEILSDYSMESETVLLSRTEKIGQWQSVSPELWEVLQLCDRWHKLSDGALDASVGQLSSLWRKARKSGRIPSEQEIATARQLCGWKYVELDQSQKRVKLTLAGLRLDFGAMGKGYVIDKAYELLAKRGLPCALVRAGGDLRCGTAPPGRQGWPIEIATLSESEKPLRMFLANCAVSSSGDLYQYLEVGGVRRSHVLDPRTGLGVPGPRMVSVIAQTSAEADAADTALCVLSDEAALAVAQKLGTIKVRLVTVTGQGQKASLQINMTPDFVP
ncbi:MAG: FAD:protein FMN transferase [Pirellulaceae bacterium]|nr:FAD:protein FMN transferase [Pirellulaceae bacterium]